MACELTSRDMVSELVIKVLKDLLDDKNINEETKLGTGGLGLDSTAKRGLFPHVGVAVHKKGCVLDDAEPSDFADSKTVGDLVDLVWDDIT